MAAKKAKRRKAKAPAWTVSLADGEMTVTRCQICHAPVRKPSRSQQRRMVFGRAQIFVLRVFREVFNQELSDRQFMSVARKVAAAIPM